MTRKVTMSELQYIWATQRMKGRWFNGCTHEWLEVNCPGYSHIRGDGFYVPVGISIFPPAQGLRDKRPMEVSS